MILPAITGAVVIRTACLHALVAPFLAHEIRQSQGVLRDIGSFSIVAEASVGKCCLKRNQFRGTVVQEMNKTYCVARIDLCTTGAHILTNEGASRQFTVAP